MYRLKLDDKHAVHVSIYPAIHASQEDSAGEQAIKLHLVYPSMNPRFMAIVTAWVRSLAPSFERMLLM